MIAIHINKPVILCNPTIYDASFEKHTLWDDCFSHPNLMVRVTRHKIISVKADVLKNWQEEGNHQTDDPAADEVQLVDLSASESELLQHEIDHLDGLTSLDRLVPKEMHSMCGCCLSPSQAAAVRSHLNRTSPALAGSEVR